MKLRTNYVALNVDIGVKKKSYNGARGKFFMNFSWFIRAKKNMMSCDKKGLLVMTYYEYRTQRIRNDCLLKTILERTDVFFSYFPKGTCLHIAQVYCIHTRVELNTRQIFLTLLFNVEKLNGTHARAYTVDVAVTI